MFWQCWVLGGVVKPTRPRRTLWAAASAFSCVCLVVVLVLLRGEACSDFAVFSGACEKRGLVSPVRRGILPWGGLCVLFLTWGQIVSQRGVTVAGNVWEPRFSAVSHPPCG